MGYMGYIMISISTQTASEYFVILTEKDGSVTNQLSRRNAVRSTLDGGAVPSDSGYSVTDRDLVILADITEAQEEILEYMIKNYTLLNVSTKSGFFVCMINRFYPDSGEVYLKFLITE